MKKILLGLILILTTNNANAIIGMSCAVSACSFSSDGDIIINVGKQDECNFGNESCYGKNSESVYNCNSCRSGYKLSPNTTYVSGCSNEIRYNECVQDCKGCSGCTSDTSWSTHSTGYQKKVTRSCNCNTCNSLTEYQCAPGYYGITKNGLSGCSACPNSGTSAPGTTSVTGCYLAAWQTGSDASGKFEYTSNCYYSN